MDRRTFLVGLAPLAGLAISAHRQPSIPRAKPQTPILRFLVTNDLHFSRPFDRPGVYAGVNRRIKWLLARTRDKDFAGKLDFVLLNGDMIHGAKLENIQAEMPAFKTAVADAFGCPVYPCVGNHENSQSEGDKVREKPYWDVFGANRVNYVFQKSGLLFVVFNNSGARKILTEIQQRMREKRLHFVREVLVKFPDLPKIYCCHIPLTTVRQDKVLEKSFGFPSWHSHDPELLQTIEEHPASVAVLAGHLHLTGVIQRRGVWHIVPSGLASYPHDSALFEVYRDRIEVAMLRAPDEMAEPYSSNIHCKRRHRIDYTDDTHPTHELYVCGNPEERAFTIPLKGART